MNTKHNSKYYALIGSMGGKERVSLYGNPGTKEGRSKGGKAAIETHRKKSNNKFKTTKKIQTIRQNAITAEFLGILFGDGHVGKYQTTISLNSETDREYAMYVCALIKKHFGIEPGLRKRKGALAMDITISSILFSAQMVKLGMVEGNKLRGDFCIPQWIMSSGLYLKAFLRGLLDTDGCVFIDRKKIKGKTYPYVGLLITSASVSLRHDIMTAFQKLNFSPTNTTRQNSVFLRKRKDVESYFNQIASHNSKHSVRYAMFLKEMWQSGRTRYTRNVVDG